jgi:tetratricopeptide (TPR) repeat protein
MDGAGFARDIEDALFGMFEARTAREQSQGFLLEGAERTRQGDLAGALREFSAAVAADPTNPAAHYNLGVSCKHAGRFREAAQAYENALLHARRSPESDEAHLQAAYCYLFLGEREACLAHLDLYQRKVAPKPGGPDAKTRMNVATFYLLLGMWDKAWPLYESRWEDPSIQAPHSWPPGKLWLGGEDPKQMTILVHAEQGIGDTIQFARYLPLLAQRAGRVRLVVPEFHKPLLRTIVDVESMFCAEGETPEYDRHIPLLSLPLALGTNADSIPSKVPYVAVPPAYRERWRERLGAKYKLRVGISWSGRPGHVNDANRSIPLHALAPLFESDASSACEWISVQKDLRSGDHVLLGQYGIRHFGDDLFDMADTAALAEQMDLVICVDTSVAHVCGALGRKAWVLLPFVPDWRWMLDRGDSPWYPSIELFRQPTAGDWNAVVQGLAARLTSVTAPK